MHRSGTSFLAGSLQAAGLALGDASTADKYNRRGNRERRDLVTFHEEMLNRRGFSWRSPPDGAVAWTAAERDAALALAADLWAGGVPWGFKDPRALLLAEGWLDLFPGASGIGIYRHPAAVAASLAHRFRMDEAEAFSLWAAYNRRLLALRDRLGLPLLRFDLPEATLRENLDALLPSLGLSPQGEGGFLDPDLRHHEAPAPVPEALRPVWDALEAAA